MKKLLIENLLIEIENMIEHQKTPTMRANDIYRLLEIEKDNFKNIDLLRAKNRDLTEMLGEMKKTKILNELDIALKLLSNYIDNDEFTLSLISVNNRNPDVDKFEIIKNLLLKTIDKYNLDTPHFMK
ncbi:MAG: hypothetical protein JXR36_04680 [Bacteroidales bacterium]|nr:hypothetical protein [Bacteroidales bacterium]